MAKTNLCQYVRGKTWASFECFVDCIPFTLTMGSYNEQQQSARNVCTTYSWPNPRFVSTQMGIPSNTNFFLTPFRKKRMTRLILFSADPYSAIEDKSDLDSC